MAKDISVRLRANTDQYNRALRQAADETRKFGGQVTNAAARGGAGMQTLGTAGVAMGGAVAAGFALSAKAAIDYESAFAGVRKTVDATGPELDAMSKSIREMSKQMPASAVEIASVAEAAGALGIQKDAIVGFSETMIQLGESTNLTADDAATAMARIANIMQTPQTQFDRLGATLVDLGNNGASTEAEIVEMATRIASAGNQIGLTEGEVLGFANALSSVGIEAEAGGSAISRVMIDTRNAVMDGGKALETFAGVAGVSSTEFQQAFEEDAAGAVTTFIEGLDRMEKSGQNSNAVLEELGLADIRVGNALRSAAGAGDLFRDSIERGNAAFEENSALTTEYEARLQTTAAQLEIAKNNVIDLAIGLGDAMLPAVREAADATGDLAGGFASMPSELQGVAAATVGVTGALAGAAGGFVLLAPRLVEVAALWKQLSVAHPGLASGIGKIGMAGAGATVGLALLAQALGNASAQADKLVASITTDIDMNSLGSMSGGLEDMKTQLKELDEEWADWGDGAALGNLGRGFRSLIEIATPLENKVFDNVEATKALRAAQKDLVTQQSWVYSNSLQLSDALGISQDAVLELASSTGVDLTQSYEEVEGAVRSAHEELTASLTPIDLATTAEEELTEVSKEMAEANGRLGDSFGSFTDPLSAYNTLLQESATATADSTADMGDSWEDYAGQTKVSLDDVSESLTKQIADQQAWKDNLVEIASRGRADVAQILAEMGPEGAGLVAAYANATGAEFDRAADLMVQAHRDGGAGAGQALREELQNAEAIGRLGTSNTVGGMVSVAASRLGEFAAVVSGYPASLVNGLNPVLSGIGRPVIPSGSMWANRINKADGGLVDYFAAGGLRESHLAEIAPAGAMRVWAEPETGGEAYIPLSPAKRARSLGIWAETGRRLGVDHTDTHFADGGFFSGADVPKPPSMGGFGNMAGYAADQAMDHTFKQVVAYVEANSLGSGPGGSVTGGDLVAIGKALQAQGFRVSRHPAFGGLPRSGHSPNSLHYKGRAIDVNYGPGGQSAEEMRAIDALMPKLAGIPFREKLWRTKGHYDHLHLAMQEGGILNPHVRDSGGPLKPGFTFNGTGGNEMVIPMADGGIIPEWMAGKSVAEIQELAYQNQVELNNNKFAFGVITAAQHLDNLARRIEHVNRTMGPLSNEARQAHEAFAQFSDGLYDAKVNENNNRFAQGALSAADHLANLERRFARAAETTGRFSDETTRARQTLLDFQDSDYQRRVNENSNRFELGLISNADQLYNLTARLKRAVKETGEFSDETMSARKNLSEFTGQFSDPISSLGNIVDRMSGHELGSDPMQGGRLVSSSEELRNMLDHQVETARLWEQQLKTLAGQGHSKGLLEDLARKGPEALGLAKALEGISPDDLSRTNAELLKYGQNVAGMFTGQSFNFGQGSIVVNVGAGADKNAVRDGVTEAMSLLRSSTARGRVG